MQGQSRLQAQSSRQMRTSVVGWERPPSLLRPGRESHQDRPDLEHGHLGEIVVPEAAGRLDFLCAEYGFTGPEVVPDESGVYPLLRRVRYQRTGLAIEISLVLSYMGEEYVASELVSEDGSGSVRRTQIESGTATPATRRAAPWTGRLGPSGTYSGTNLARTAEPYAADPRVHGSIAGRLSG